MDELEIHPVTPDRWPDLVVLFERPGPRGAWPRTSVCYCMFWRLEPAEYETNFRQRSRNQEGGGPNKDLMGELVGGGGTPGLLAYRHGIPVGWVAVSLRSELVRLIRLPGSLTDGSADDRTWSITCFYVYRTDQHSGVGSQLLDAAVDRAAQQGASSIEAYPVKPGSVDPYTGYGAMFERAGFSLMKAGRGRGRSLWRRQL